MHGDDLISIPEGSGEPQRPMASSRTVCRMVDRIDRRTWRPRCRASRDGRAQHSCPTTDIACQPMGKSLETTVYDRTQRPANLHGENGVLEPHEGPRVRAM